MTLWLSRQYNGEYMLTAFEPTLEEVVGTGHKDLYILPGDPIGIRNLCNQILKVVNSPAIKHLQSIQIELNGNTK
jgi:hypothetical protein